jgi:serine/threonine-protein kinase
VLHQIGSGVLGPVFRTYDPQADKLVAVKVFRLDLLPEDVARLADALRRLNGAPGFVAAGLENTSAYLATDYLAGETLDVALRHLAPAPLDVALPIIERAAALIDAAWTGSFGHGALHPRDIFITPDSHEVAITGFGVVPALETLGAKPPVRRPYTAPERAAGSEWDIRADIYSLAAIAHELLTGRRPAGPSEQDGSLPASMPPETRVHVRRVLSKALAESPSQRFATAAEFAAALGDPGSLPDPVVPVLADASAFAPAAASDSAKAPADKTADTLDAPMARPALEHPVELTFLPVAEKRDEFDLNHVMQHEPAPSVIVPPGPAAANADKPVEKPASNRAAKSRTVAMPVAKPQERQPSAGNTPAYVETSAGRPIDPEPRFRAIEPELVRTPPVDFAMPPPTPWVPMVAVAIACLILGAAIDHQWMLSRAQPAASVAAPVPAGPSASSSKTPAQPAKDAGRADTEVAVTEPQKAAPPQTPKSAPLPGKITVRSVPAGATVTIDGKPAGRTPLTESGLSLAGHSVVLSRPGFVTESHRVTLSRRVPASTVSATLKAERRAPATPAAPAARTGSVSVDSRPRGASITIDGRAIGQSPASIPGLTPGNHSLRLELAGHKPLVTTFTVKAGETARVAVTLEIR